MCEWVEKEARKNEIWDQLVEDFNVPDKLLSELCELERGLTLAETG